MQPSRHIGRSHGIPILLWKIPIYSITSPPLILIIVCIHCNLTFLWESHVLKTISNRGCSCSHYPGCSWMPLSIKISKMGFMVSMNPWSISIDFPNVSEHHLHVHSPKSPLVLLLSSFQIYMLFFFSITTLARAAIGFFLDLYQVKLPTCSVVSLWPCSQFLEVCCRCSSISHFLMFPLPSSHFITFLIWGDWSSQHLSFKFLVSAFFYPLCILIPA